MAVRNSEYARVAGDTYITPTWCWQALHTVEPWSVHAWDPCPANYTVNFLTVASLPDGVSDIASNPPYGRLAVIASPILVSIEKVKYQR